MNRLTQTACELTHPAEFLAGLCTAARRAYAIFAQNPEHPSLRFKKLAGHENIWSVRINEQYRAVGECAGDTIFWAWIGTHNEFDNLFG
jgi:hypothetical protein